MIKNESRKVCSLVAEEERGREKVEQRERVRVNGVGGAHQTNDFIKKFLF